jgi:ABC-2 type transport system ATP-binding protein
MMSAVAAIQTTSLSKRYGRAGDFALADLDLTVHRGEIFGYLGPNGAGKTTTIRLLLDFIRLSRGSAQVLGMDAQAQSLEIRRHVSFLPVELSLWDNLSGWQVIRYMMASRGTVQQAYVHYADRAPRLRSEQDRAQLFQRQQARAGLDPRSDASA